MGNGMLKERVDIDFAALHRANMAVMSNKTCKIIKWGNTMFKIS
jgi:hypothetical protein